WMTDQRANGFMIRVVDTEQLIQDAIDINPMPIDPVDPNDGLFGKNDDWPALTELMEESDPCAKGAAALIPYKGGSDPFPANAQLVARDLAKALYYAGPNNSCVEITTDPYNSCINTIIPGTYYSYQDFYYRNPAFFDCMVDNINSTTSVPWNFQALHTPTHFILYSPEHYELIPDGYEITTDSECLCNARSRRAAGQRRQIDGCYLFRKPCEQRLTHCLCEDYAAAKELVLPTLLPGEDLNLVIGGRYATEYGGTATEWLNYLDLLEDRCENVIYDETTSQAAVDEAILLIEDLADGVRDIPSHPNLPAPVALSCFNPFPDPCEEGQTIADFHSNQAFADAVQASTLAFENAFTNSCLSPALAPDELRMSYIDREYHFTLYYYTPDGQLHATVPPEGTRPISDSDPAVFEQIATLRDNAWSGNYRVPEHRRNSQRADQLMTLYDYNAFGNLVRTQSPELRGTGTEGDNLASYGQVRTLYDDLGRPRFTQDPRLEETFAVTYLRYDEQGRTIESGRFQWGFPFTDLEAFVNDQSFPSPALAALSERLINYYDETSGFSPGTQSNLRQRVVKTEYYEDETTLSHATHYDYDIRGNVRTIWQEDCNVQNPNGFVKRLDYTYGLVDGLTYRFDYQAGEGDAYSHRYCYDDNNRLTHTLTSEGGNTWDLDQRNFYRLDGLLARMELGDYLIQGSDYAYTLQGWIKGVNASSNLAHRDPGNDGASSSGDPLNQLHRWTARDAFAFTLHYHLNDYTSIHNFAPTDRFYADIPSANGVFFQGVDGPAPGLYNGNIAAMQTALTGPNGSRSDYLLKGYQYDQLMRLKVARTAVEPAVAGVDHSVFNDNVWEATASSTGDYQVSLNYDKNGNILSLARNGYAASGTGTGQLMDLLTYNYPARNAFGIIHNQLNHVDDAVAASVYGTDLATQGSNNYTYDRIGNLIA
ncbi:MAG: hypothetical protein AAF146_24060, partial [Bacteroidota bacterium]